jgi:L-ribulose-5-phosphate 3-epimerase
MKLSMMTYTMARGLAAGEEFSVPWLCEFTREMGIDAIDWVTLYGHDPAEVRRVTDDYGLLNCCYTFFADLNFASADERAAGAEEFKRGVDDAVTLGADKIMLPISGKPPLTRDESRANWIEGLKEVIGYADDAGVTVTVEHFPNPASPFIISSDMNQAIAEVPQLRVTLDSGNCVTAGEAAVDAYLNSADKIVHAHFKDFEQCVEGDAGAWQGLSGNWYRGTLVGEGVVDNQTLAKAMVEKGYDGYVNFEYEGNTMTPTEATIIGLQRMREWLRLS